MIDVKRPELLDASLGVVSMLHPSNGSLKLNMDGPSEATLTLEDKAESIPMHGWVKMYNQLGFVGIFRRISRNRTITSDNTYNLKHGIDILQDSIWDEETTFTGTKTEFLTAILNKQTQLINGVKPWTLGSCADTSTVKKDISYDNLLDLFTGAAEQGGDYYFSYDQSSFPWTVSLVAKPSEVASEFRLNRNIDRCRINDNDSELCTRLILNVNKMVKDTELSSLTGDSTDVDQNESVYRTYNNSAAQENYGVIVKTADIDVENDTFPSGPFPEADAWAADFLARRAEPLLQIEIDGYVLKGFTGFDWDESRIATKVRVALPDYATAIEERCVTINYTSLYGDPDKVTVSLANALPTYTSSFTATQETVKSTAKTSRSYGRQAESFDQHFKITNKAGDVLKQAGMHLDANGLLVYADDNEKMVGAKFEVQANKIGMVVGTYDTGGNYIKVAEIATAVNNAGEGIALINADHVNISATTTAHTLAGEIEYDSQGRLVIKNAGGLYVEKTEQGVTSYFGVWDKGELTGGVMAQQINGQTVTKIRGDRVVLGTNENSTTTINGFLEADTISGTSILRITKNTYVSENLYAKDVHIGTSGNRALVFDPGHSESSVSINRSMANEMNKTTQLRVKVVSDGGDNYKVLYLPIGVSSYLPSPSYSSYTGWMDAGSFSKAASATHTVTGFDTNAIAGESSDGYTNNNQFYSISGSGSTAEVAIVVTGTWYCDGVSRSANRYIKRAPTNVYKKGWNDCRSRAMSGTPMYDGAGNAYYRLPSAI